MGLGHKAWRAPVYVHYGLRASSSALTQLLRSNGRKGAAADDDDDDNDDNLSTTWTQTLRPTLKDQAINAKS